MPSTSTLRAYTGDVDDNAPTRLYHGSGSEPPPAPRAPRLDKPTTPGAKAIEPPSVFSISRKKTKYVAAAGIGLVGLGAAYFFMGGRGALTVTVSGPNGRAVEGVSVSIDGVQKCDQSPCRIEGLSAGAHLVRASGKGYQPTADQAISITAGEQATQNVSLAPSGEGTGVRVSAAGSGLKLFIDGKEIGELPQTEKNLSPGSHTIKVGGNDRYAPYEEKVDVEDGQMKTIGPLKLRVLKGLATFSAGPGADGARVLLDGRMLPSLPATIEVPVPPSGKTLNLTASKPGFATYQRTIAFDDGIAEKTFEITMAAGDFVASTSRGSSAPVSSPPLSRPVTTPTMGAKPAAATGKAMVNLNSIPASNVILNGKPLGTTPKANVAVTPGPQTVVFVHPDLGRKVVTGTVAAGETKAFSARFK